MSRVIAFVAPALTALLLSGGLVACKEKPPQQAAPPPAAVSVVRLQTAPVTLTTELPGRTSPFRTADVRPQVSGVVRERAFTEGAEVEEGRQLYLIDPAPYQASLASAEATLARNRATAASARSTVARYRPLVQARAVSQQDLDTAIAAQGQAEADIASAEAGVQTARLNLAYTRVASPITGRTGRSSVTPGALVTSEQANALVTITQLDPIFVDVTQPSTTLLRLRRELAAGRVRAAPDGGAEVKLILEDGSEYAQAGRLQFTEVIVDQGTGSVTLRAVFPNPDRILLPGMFVRARIEEGVAEHGLLVPQQGVTRNQRGEATALVVGDDGKAQPRVIQTDRAIGNRWLISDGLREGERVIVEGVQRVRPGAPLQVTEISLADLDGRTGPQAGNGPPGNAPGGAPPGNRPAGGAPANQNNRAAAR